MIAFAELLGRFKAHRLEVVPTGRIVRHGNPVLVAQDNAGPVKDAADGRIELTSDLRTGSPHRTQDSGHVEDRNLMDRAIERRPGINRAEMTLPLVADLGVG